VLTEGEDHLLGCLVAALVAAGAVSDQQQQVAATPQHADKKPVLIALADQSDIGHPGRNAQDPEVDVAVLQELGGDLPGGVV
jgi:hypothetical protein